MSQARKLPEVLPVHPLRKPAKVPSIAPVVAEVLPVQPASQATILPAPLANGQSARVDLGPALPMAVYTCTETWNPERIGALALYCSDGRWGEAFDEFCHKRLLLPRYDRWAVPGGPAWLAPRDTSKDLFRTTREQLDFLVQVHGLERLVLITHYGCAFYRKLLHEEPEDCLSPQMEDLQSAAKSLRGWFPELRVDGYLAMQKGSCISFHQVDC